MEKNWINEAKKGDRRSQSALYRQYRRYWYTICLRYQSNKEDAEDSMQNALINIFSKLHLFNEEKGSFKDWSAQVVVNDNLMFLRNKRPTLPLESSHERSTEGPDLDIDQPTLKDLTLILQSLPAGYRQVFNLYVLEGYSHDEISEILSISPGTSKSQLFKARSMIKKKVSDRIKLKAV